MQSVFMRVGLRADYLVVHGRFHLIKRISQKSFLLHTVNVYQFVKSLPAKEKDIIDAIMSINTWLTIVVIKVQLEHLLSSWTNLFIAVH